MCAHTTVRTATHCHAHYPHTQPRTLPHTATNPLPECCHPPPHTAARIHCRTLPLALPHTVAHCRTMPQSRTQPRALRAHCRAHGHKLPLALLPPHSASCTLSHTVAHTRNNTTINNNFNNTSILKCNLAQTSSRRIHNYCCAAYTRASNCSIVGYLNHACATIY